MKTLEVNVRSRQETQISETSISIGDFCTLQINHNYNIQQYAKNMLKHYLAVICFVR